MKWKKRMWLTQKGLEWPSEEWGFLVHRARQYLPAWSFRRVFGSRMVLGGKKIMSIVRTKYGILTL
jgi:hypothetical protein